MENRKEKKKMVKFLETYDNYVDQYATKMRESLAEHLFQLETKEFDRISDQHMKECVSDFKNEQSANKDFVKHLKAQLQKKNLELFRENLEKDMKSAVIGGAAAGTATGLGLATTGIVGTVFVASAIPTVVFAGAFIAVGLAAVGAGVGIGFGIKKIVETVGKKKKKKEK